MGADYTHNAAVEETVAVAAAVTAQTPANLLEALMLLLSMLRNHCTSCSLRLRRIFEPRSRSFFGCSSLIKCEINAKEQQHSAAFPQCKTTPGSHKEYNNSRLGGCAAAQAVVVVAFAEFSYCFVKCVWYFYDK